MEVSSQAYWTGLSTQLYHHGEFSLWRVCQLHFDAKTSKEKYGLGDPGVEDLPGRKV